MSGSVIHWRLRALRRDFPTAIDLHLQDWVARSPSLQFELSNASEGSYERRAQYGLMIPFQQRSAADPQQAWQAPAAERLLAVQRFKNNTFRRWYTECPEWRTLNEINCKPVGGHWRASRETSPLLVTTCRHILCPWCYLRRYADICGKLSTSRTLHFRAANGVLTQGLGLYGLVNTIAFEYWGIEDDLTPWTLPRAGSLFSQQCHRWVNDRLIRDPRAGLYVDYGQPEFRLGLRTLMPLFRFTEHPGHFQLGWKATYLHQQPLPLGETYFTLRPLTPFTAPVLVTRLQQQSHPIALLTALPYPIELLDANAKLARLIMTTKVRLRLYVALSLKPHRPPRDPLAKCRADPYSDPKLREQQVLNALRYAAGLEPRPTTVSTLLRPIQPEPSTRPQDIVPEPVGKRPAPLIPRTSPQ